MNVLQGFRPMCLGSTEHSTPEYWFWGLAHCDSHFGGR